MANKKKRDPLVEDPMYRVWRPDEPEDEGRDYGAIDVQFAAKLYAEYCHSHRDGWEWNWPVVFNVRVSTTGEVFVVEVQRESVPEFVASAPLPLKMDPAVHVRDAFATICNDIRLQCPTREWPEGQTARDLRLLLELQEPARRLALEEITCAKCKRRAPSAINARIQIGAA